MKNLPRCANCGEPVTKAYQAEETFCCRDCFLDWRCVNPRQTVKSMAVADGVLGVASARNRPVDIRRYPDAQILDPHERRALWYLRLVPLARLPGVQEKVDEWIQWNLADDEGERDRVDYLAWAMADPLAFTKAHPIMVTSEGIVDGWHRAAALREMGMFDEDVYVLYAPEL